MTYDGNIEKSFERLNDAMKAGDEAAGRDAALDVARCVVECMARIAAALETLVAKDASR
jgi:hypothetical protein